MKDIEREDLSAEQIADIARMSHFTAEGDEATSALHLIRALALRLSEVTSTMERIDGEVLALFQSSHSE